MIAQSIQTLLTGIPEVTAAAKTNVFLGEAPENTARPYIVYDFEDYTAIKTLAGNSNLQSELWVVKLTGQDLAELISLKDAIIASFTAERTMFTATLDDIDTEKDREAKLEHIHLFFRLHFY